MKHAPTLPFLREMYVSVGTVGRQWETDCRGHIVGVFYMPSASNAVTPQGVEAELGVGWVAFSTSQREYRPIHVQ